jgi:hypothetical protein
MKKLNSLEEAYDLLESIHFEMARYGLLVMNKRPHNAQTLSDLNLTASGQRAIIESLRPEDYCSGPEEDEKYPWKIVAVFGKNYGNTELYIKLSVGYDQTAVVCLSFHAAAHPMPYQFK